jgi:hypothetical protein
MAASKCLGAPFYGRRGDTDVGANGQGDADCPSDSKSPRLLCRTPRGDDHDRRRRHRWIPRRGFRRQPGEFTGCERWHRAFWRPRGASAGSLSAGRYARGSRKAFAIPRNGGIAGGGSPPHGHCPASRSPCCSRSPVAGRGLFRPPGSGLRAANPRPGRQCSTERPVG